MKITAHWLQIARTRTTRPDRLQYRKIKELSIHDGSIIIAAEGVERKYEGKTYNEDSQKLIILDVTNDDLKKLYFEIQQVLFNKIK